MCMTYVIYCYCIIAKYNKIALLVVVLRSFHKIGLICSKIS